jgi:predicted nucleic acid-binding Zn ribbon protein
MTNETTVMTQEMKDAELKEGKKRRRNVAITAAFVIIGILLIVYLKYAP